MEERDNLRTILYGWARFGLYWLIMLFATVVGRTAVLGILGTLLPRLALYDNPETLSFFSWLIALAFLIPLFWDDGKRHTAYGTFEPVTVAIILLLTGIVFYAQVFLLDYMQDPRAQVALTNIYFTDFWLSRLNRDPQIYGLVGTVITVVLCMLTYLISGRVYRGKFDEED